MMTLLIKVHCGLIVKDYSVFLCACVVRIVETGDSHGGYTFAIHLEHSSEAMQSLACGLAHFHSIRYAW
jgi:hypothetical protein